MLGVAIGYTVTTLLALVVSNQESSVAADELIAVGEDENGQRIDLRLHQKLRITLPEVRTSGFGWNLRSVEERIVSLLEDDIQTSGGAVGGNALHHWVLRAEEPGVATIVLEYRRPWERAAGPARIFSISVFVA